MLPIAELLGVEFRTWPLIVSSGVVICWILLMRRTSRLGYAPLPVYVWIVSAFPVGAFGSMLLASAVAGGTLFASGMTMLGSVLCCVAYSILYIAIVWREPPGRLLDAVAFTLPLSVAVGRFGCLLNGCCYGKPMATSHSEYMHALALRVSWLSPDAKAGVHYAGADPRMWIWDLPLFLIVAALCTLALSEIARRSFGSRWPAGGLFLFTLGCDAAARFPIEFLRDEATVGVSLFNPWQLIVGALALTAFAGLIVLQRACRPIQAVEEG